MTQREIHIKKLDEARKELANAGPVHARDLKKYIRRMERELILYDQFRYEAKTVLRNESLFCV
jgi:hypothetical protein